MNCIAIILNDTKPNALQLFEKFQKYIENKNFDIYINQVPENTDIIFTIGGDGTMVRALKQYPNVPTIGLNGGTLGFLTEINENNLEQGIERVLNHDYYIEFCNMLVGNIVRNGEIIYENVAINDIVISRSTALEMIRFNVYVNGKMIKQYNADGFIVSTPLGSTGYSLSEGGPLIEPTSNLIELTPIAPHSLINRSIVIDDTKEIVLEIIESRNNKKNTLVSFDGEDAIELIKNDKIIIKKSNTQLKLIRISNESFVENLAKKMYMC